MSMFRRNPNPGGYKPTLRKNKGESCVCLQPEDMEKLNIFMEEMQISRSEIVTLAVKAMNKAPIQDYDRIMRIIGRSRETGRVVRKNFTFNRSDIKKFKLLDGGISRNLSNLLYAIEDMTVSFKLKTGDVISFKSEGYKEKPKTIIPEEKPYV